MYKGLMIFLLSFIMTFSNINKTIDIQTELVSESHTMLQKKTIEHTSFEIPVYEMTEEDILEEIRLGEMELLAQLIQAEAGNQDLTGMRLVADVVLNRVGDPRFPNTVEEVIFQMDPVVQFGVMADGAFEKAGWNISENAFKAAEMEWYERLDNEVLYFNNSLDCSGERIWKYGGHWFGY